MKLKPHHLFFLFLFAVLFNNSAHAKFERWAMPGMPADLVSNETIVTDLNGDHYPDVMFLNINSEDHPLRAFSNQKGVSLKELSIEGLTLHKESNLKVIKGALPNVLGADEYLAVVRYLNGDQPTLRPVEFYRMKQDADTLKFTQLTGPSFPALQGHFGDMQFFDYNRDGKIDLIFSQFYVGTSNSYEAGGLVLLKGTDDGFVDATAEAGLFTAPGMDVKSFDAPVPSYNVTVSDIDGDGWMDIIVSAYGRRWNKLLFNHNGHFENHAMELGYAADQNGISDYRGNGNNFAAVCADADNDGKIDCFQGTVAHAWAGDTSDLSAILWNELPKPFTRAGVPRSAHFRNQADLSAAWGDIDNDTLQDLIISNSEYPPETKLVVLMQATPRNLINKTKTMIDRFDSPYGAQLVDLNLDGHLDLVSSSSSARGNPNPFARIYRNVQLNSPNASWLELKFPDMAIGAKVVVTLGNQHLMREVNLGFGSSTEQSSLLHFGLGKAPKVIPVTVTWPTGEHCSFSVTKNHYYDVEQTSPGFCSANLVTP